MITRKIVSGVYAIPLGMVNAFLVDDGELALIDTGLPGSEGRILRAVQELGKRPADLRHILITHLHSDHVGSLAALQRTTGAAVYMHPADAAAHRQGQSMRPVQPAPGLVSSLVHKLLIRGGPGRVEAATVDHELKDGQVLEAAGGIRAIFAPGHTAGHVVFLYPGQGGVLFAGDAASHMFGLGLSLIYEDLERGRRTLLRFTELQFEVACFSHGAPIVKGAAGKFRQKWRVAR